MKLHLPKQLFVALMACCSVATSFVTTVASSTMIAGAITYSLIQEEARARIITWTGATDANSHIAGNWTTDDGAAFTWNGAGDAGIRHDGNGRNILQFDTPGNTQIDVSFDTFTTGGIHVQDGATGYAIKPSNNSRPVLWRASYDEEAAEIGGVAGKTNFIIGEDFSLGLSSNRWTTWSYAVAANYDIAGGKTLSVFAQQMTFSGDAPATNYEHVVQGGGTLNLNLSTSYDLSRSANWTVTEGSIIHMSAVGAGATVTFGALSLDDGHINMGTGNSTLTSQMVVGAAGARITGGDVAAGNKTTLTGRVTLTDGGESLTLNGNFVLGAGLEFDLGVGEDIANDTYTLLVLDGNDSELEFSLSDLTILNLDDPLRIASLIMVGDELRLTIADPTNKVVTFATGDITWDLDDATTPWMSSGAAASFDNDDVAIIGEGSADGGTVTLNVDVSPRTVTFTGEGDWTLSGDGSITAGNLVKEGAGALTISTSNTYSGGTALTGGTLILAADNAAGTGAISMSGADTVLELTNLASLGTAGITFTSGTIKYGAGMTASLHEKITLADGAGSLTLDINGNSVVWGAATAGNLSILNTGAADAAAEFDYAYDLSGRNVAVASNTTFVSTTSLTQGNGVGVSGDGVFRIENTATYTIRDLSGFTGTLQATNGGQITIIRDINTAAERFALESETVAAEATEVQAIVLGDYSNQTLYIDKLSGYSSISVTYGTATNRGFDILMEENNTFHGNLYCNSSGGADDRWGTWTIGGDALTFTWTGLSSNNGAYGTLGSNAKLLVKSGTTMTFATNEAGTAGGQWADDITLESGSKLLISRTDNLGFMQLATGNDITGEGRIEVSGKAILQGANTYTGGTNVTATGALTLSTATAHSTGPLSIMAGGTVSATNGLTIGVGQTVTNAGNLSLDNTLTIATALTNEATGTITLGANTVFDLSGIVGAEEGELTRYTVFDNTAGGAIDFSALTADGILASSNITGVATVGLVWTLNDDGTITAAVDANSRIYAIGGTLELGTGASGFEGGETFADGNSISFTTLDAQVNLVGDVDSAGIRVAGVEVDYTGGAYTLTTDSISVEEGGSFIQNDNTISEATNFLGDVDSSLIFNIGDGNSITRTAQIVDFLGDVIVRSGTLVIDSHDIAQGMDMKSLTVEAGAALSTSNVTFAEAADIPIILKGSEDDATQQATWNTGNVTHYGALTSTGYSTINVSEVLNIRDAFFSNGDMTININGAFAVNVFSSLTGSGTVNVNGTGTLDLSLDGFSTHTHTGDLVMGTGTTLLLGSALGYDRTVNVAFDKIVMSEGSTLRLGMTDTSDLDSVNLVLEGTIVNHDNFANGGDQDVAMKSLSLTGDNTFNINLKAGYTFSTLTGMGNMTITGAATDGNDYRFDFDHIEDFGGTFTGAGLLELNIATANQAAGVTGTFAGTDVNAVDFVKDGEGNLVIEQNFNATNSVLINEGGLNVGGTLTTLSFAKNGAGAVDINTLNIGDSGLLQMTYGGTVDIANYGLTGDLRLRYDPTQSGGTLMLSDTALATVDSIIIDLADYSLESLTDGVSLGISKEYDMADITVLGLEAGSYNIVEDGDYYKLTATTLVDVGWDSNWGSAELSKRPVSVPEVADLGNVTTYLYDGASETPVYTDGSTTRIELTGGGGAAAQVIGGLFYGSGAGATVVETDVWIKAVGGDFLLLAGGNITNNWANQNVIEFRGNTHIEVDGANVGHIVGGSLREGGHTLFTGDTYISVFTNTVTGSIIGAGTTRHTDGSLASRKTTFTGDTNIYVYTPLTVSSAGVTLEDALTNDSIIGGHHWGSSSTVALTFNGNTNVTVNLSDYTGGTATMVKSIIGGGRVGSGSSYTHTGDTNISIIGQTGVTFDDWIMGGIWHVSNSPTSSLVGNVNIEISGDSTFTQRIVGGANHGNGTASITGTTNITLDGGTFTNRIIGGYNQHAGTTTITGTTNITLDGGTYSGFVLGGALIAAGTANLVNDGGISTSIVVNGGTVTSGIVGHSRMEGAGSSLMTGSSSIVVNGGDLSSTAATIIGGSHVLAASTGQVTQGGSNITLNAADTAYAATIIGGHRMEGAVAIAADSTLGDVSITVAGADLDATLYGGSYVERTSGTLTQGNVSIALESGSVGSVYAAGYQGGNGAMTTASTTIEILAGVTIDANSRIDGGYQLLGTPTSSSSVTGDQTLLFSSAATDYAFDSTVSFANFKTVEVTEADSTVSISSSLGLMGSAVEKTGAGSLQLAAVDHDTALTISAGTVKLAANSQSNSITSINVASGAALDMTAASTGINGDLTLRGGSSLAITSGVGGAAIGGGSLTLIGAETTRINLTIEGLTYTAGMEITETLFSGILSGDQIDGIDLTQLLDNGMRGIDASDYLTITGITDLSGLYIAYDEDNDNLILTNVINSTLVWGGGPGAWTDDNEWTKDGTLATFEDNDNVIFNAGTAVLTGVVTVGANVTVADMSFEGNGSPDANVAYTFNGALITVTGDLSVLEGASATFANIGLDDADVVIGASSTLTLLGGSMVNSLDNEGTLSVGSVGDPRDFTISNATDNGGTLEVSGNLTLAGDNTFDALTVGGNVISTGALSMALSMAQGSSITGAFGGTGLTVTGTEAASSTTVGSITNTLASLTNANGSLTIGTMVSVGEFVNAGHVALQTADGKKYALAITSATSQGGDITAFSLTLAGYATATNTFGVIDIASNVTTDSQLSVEVGSTITGALAAEGLTVTGGDTTSTTSIGSVTGDLASLSNGAGTLSITSGDLTITESLSNTGSLSVAGELDLDAATTAGGKVTAGSLSLAGGDSFTSITTTGAITSAGALSLSEASTAGSLSGVTDLSVGTSLTVSSTAMTSVTSLAGAGSLQLSGGLTTAATSSIDSLTLTDTLTLGGAMTVTGTLMTASTLTVNVSYLPTDSEVALTATTVAGLTSVNFELTDAALANLGLASGETYTILDSATSSLMSATLNGLAIATAGSYEYSVSTNAEGDVILLATLVGNTWEASGSTDWNTAANWATGTPSASREAIFDGGGSTVMNLSAAGTASSITVDIAAGAAVTEYSITGLELTTGSLAVRSGKLIVDNDLTITDDTTAIATATGALTLDRTGELEIGANGALTAASGSMDDTNSLTITDGGSLTVTGAFDATGVTIANDGTLSLGEGSVAEALTGTGDLEVNGGVTITTVTGDSVTLNAASQLNATTVTLTGSLTGAGSLTATDVTLGTAASVGLLDATTLTLNEAGNVIATLQTGTINFESALASGTPLLTVSDINPVTGTTIDIDMAGFDATTSIGSYTIIGKGGSTDLSWDTFDLSDADKTSFNDQLLAGKDVVLGTSSTGDLTLTITDADNRIWDTADLFAVTPGLEDADPSVKIEIVGADGKIVSYDALDSVERVMVTENVTVDLTALILEPSDTQGLLLKNLGGTEGKTMSIVGNGVDDSLVTLYNDADSYAQNGIDVTDATLQVRGDSGATLELESLTMTDSALDLVLGGSMELGSATLTGSHITVGDTSSLVSEGDLTLTDSTVTVEGGGNASLGHVELKGNSVLTEETGGVFIVDSLTGDASSSVSGQIEIKGNDGNFDGTYETNTDITVASGSKQTLTVGTNLNVQGQQNADIILKVEPADVLTDSRYQISSIKTAGSKVTLTGNTVDVPLFIKQDSEMTGGSLHITLDATNLERVLNNEGATLQTIMTSTQPGWRAAGSSLTLDNVDIYVSALTGGVDTGVLDLTGLTGVSDIVIGTLHDNVIDTGSTVILDGSTLSRVFNNARLVNGQIVVDLNTRAYSDLATTENGAAGLDMLSGALIKLNSKITGDDPEYKNLADVMKSLGDYAEAGNRSAADALGAATAGSSVTALGSSMLSAVEQQMQSVRNRTTSMGGNPYAAQTGPVFNAWIAAEGSSNTLDNDGTASGHDYSTWGGSVGFYSDLSETVTVGMALNALSGSVSSDVADIGTGDLNTYGISAYAVVLDSRWSHTFIASASIADATMDRTVTHMNGSYSTEGSTDGYGLGLMYEVGYTYALNEDSSTSWQPIFNVSLVHASITGYDETGSDAALSVGDQSSTYASFGLGGRIATTIGESVFNRDAVLSARALLKLDAGDRSTSADVAFINERSIQSSVEGAEPGAFGVELGAGLNIPVGDQGGAIFMDAGVELRSGMNNVNGSVGYQIEF